MEEQKNDGGTGLTAGDSVSVSAADQLPHDASALIDHSGQATAELYQRVINACINRESAIDVVCDAVDETLRVVREQSSQPNLMGTSGNMIILSREAKEELMAMARERDAKPPKPQCGKWQDIDSAPKDGSYFIAWDRGAGQILFTAHWDHDRIYTEYERWKGPITHWMPLPEPPK